MATPDRKLRIEIETTADTSGVAEAKKAVEGLEDAAKKAAEESDREHAAALKAAAQRRAESDLQEVSSRREMDAAKAADAAMEARAQKIAKWTEAARIGTDFVIDGFNLLADTIEQVNQAQPGALNDWAVEARSTVVDLIKSFTTVEGILDVTSGGTLSRLKSYAAEAAAIKEAGDRAAEMIRQHEETEKRRKDQLADKRILEAFRAENEEIDRQSRLLEDETEIARMRGEALRAMKGVPETPESQEAAAAAKGQGELEAINQKIAVLGEKIDVAVADSQAAIAEGRFGVAEQIQQEMQKAEADLQKAKDERDALVKKNEAAADKVFAETTEAIERKSAENVQRILDTLDTTGLNDQQRLALETAKTALADGKVAASENAQVNAAMSQLFSSMRVSGQEQHSLIKAMQDEMMTVAQRNRELWDRMNRLEQLQRAGGYTR